MNEPIKLSGKFQEPMPTPPSEDIAKRTPEWYEHRGMALWYLWGRMDMGEKRDVNDNWRFAETWADAQWHFKAQRKHHLPSLQGALEAWDKKEPF